MSALPTPEERQRAADRLHAAETFLAGARALKGNPAWVEFSKMMADELTEQRGKHEDPKKHPMRRAEHLWAVKCLEMLNTWLAQETERKEKIARKADEALEP